MTFKQPCIAVLYRWKLHPGTEDAFKTAWTLVSEQLLQRGSLGSRLHQSKDGIWYSYAQWPSLEARIKAFEQPLDEPALKIQRASICEYFPEIILEPIVDLMLSAQ